MLLGIARPLSCLVLISCASEEVITPVPVPMEMTQFDNPDDCEIPPSLCDVYTQTSTTLFRTTQCEAYRNHLAGRLLASILVDAMDEPERGIFVELIAFNVETAEPSERTDIVDPSIVWADGAWTASIDDVLCTIEPTQLLTANPLDINSYVQVESIEPDEPVRGWEIGWTIRWVDRGPLAMLIEGEDGTLPNPIRVHFSVFDFYNATMDFGYDRRTDWGPFEALLELELAARTTADTSGGTQIAMDIEHEVRNVDDLAKRYDSQLEIHSLTARELFDLTWVRSERFGVVPREDALRGVTEFSVSGTAYRRMLVIHDHDRGQPELFCE